MDLQISNLLMQSIYAYISTHEFKLLLWLKKIIFLFSLSGIRNRKFVVDSILKTENEKKKNLQWEMENDGNKV